MNSSFSRFILRPLFCVGLVTLVTACAGPAGPGEVPRLQRPAIVAPLPVSSADGGERDDTPVPVEAAASGSDIYFAFGASNIDAVGKEKLKSLAERLKASPRDEVLLIGSTDYLGSRAYNLAMAEQRVAEVVRELRALGVAARQIKSKVAGNALADSACKTAACRQQRRRVQVIYNPAQK